MDIEFFKRNPLYAIGAVAILFIVVSNFQSGKYQRDAATRNAISEQRRQLDLQTRQLEISLDVAKQRAPIAEERYKNGCILVVAENDPTKLTSITEGKPVGDSSRPGAALSDGNVVCDQNGYTGVIAGGVVTDAAFTGDRTVVLESMRRIGYDGTNGSVFYEPPTN